MTIQVLGAGCASCKKLHEMVLSIIEEHKIKATVEYITDVSKIVELGIMTSPVLTVDGKVVMTGFLPDKDKICKAIQSGKAEKKDCDCTSGCC